jgi:CBS domain-containing protein
MRVKDAMTKDVRMTRPDQRIRDAALLMAELDIGVLPVEENDKLIGMITDRDIAVRAVAEGRSPDTPIRDVMTREVLYCFEDQTVDEVTQNMADKRVRRLPVMNRQKRLVGILSLGDVAQYEQSQDEAGEALGGISQPGGAHSQSEERH